MSRAISVLMEKNNLQQGILVIYFIHSFTKQYVAILAKEVQESFIIKSSLQLY